MDIDLTYLNLGKQAFSKGDFTKAMEYFNAYINQPCLIYGDAAVMLRGYCKYYLKRYEEAIRDLTIASKDIKDNSDIYRIRGNCHKYLEKDADSAIRDYNTAIKINNQDTGAYVELYEVFLLCSSYTEARNVFDRLLKLNPTNIELFRKLAKTSFDKKDYYTASSTCEDVLKNKPDDTIMLEFYAISNVAIGNTNIAMKAFNKLILLSENSPNDTLGLFYKNRAKLHSQLNDFKQAIKDFRMAYSLGHDDALSQIKLLEKDG